MRNPFWRLKTLPWGTLLLASVLVVAIATGADILLGVGLSWLIGGLGSAFVPLLRLLVLVLPVVVGFALGALAMMMMERVFHRVFLNTAVLWALVACLALVLLFKSFLPIPAVFVTFEYGLVVGTLLGIFVTGKRHWR